MAMLLLLSHCCSPAIDPKEKKSGKGLVTHVTEASRMQQGLLVHNSYMEEIKTFAERFYKVGEMKRFGFLVINESFRGSDRKDYLLSSFALACEAASQAGEGWEGSAQPPGENPTNRGVHLGLSPDTHHGRQAEDY